MQEYHNNKRLMTRASLRKLLPSSLVFLGYWLGPACRGQLLRRACTGSIFKYYQPWKESQDNEYMNGPIRDRVPWITFEARDFIEARLKPEMKVFEYGTGGSTLFFADRVRSVVSVENDATWAASLQQILSDENNSNVELRLAEGSPLADNEMARPEDPDFSHSGSRHYNRFDFSPYVSVIDEYPDATFDLVLVDGRARAACLHRAAPKVRPGGMLILDNSDRQYYTKNLGHELAEWERYQFYGPIPYLENFIETTVWIHPGDNCGHKS